jgi:tetratricopeptide (TPR) repeat protein
VTHHAVDDVRLKTVRSPWALAGGWLSARAVAIAAAVCIAALFAALVFMLRDKPLPRRHVDFPAPPQVATQISAAQERLKVNPQDIVALVELGTLKFEKGPDAYVEAISDLEEARDLGALDPRIFYCLGIMYQEEGLFPFALTEYKRFLRHYPEDKEVRMLMAKLYYKMGLFQEAVNEYDRLKFQDPSDPMIEENLGVSLWGGKLVDRAVTSFVQLKTQGGDYSRRAEFYLGQIALEAGKNQEAYDHFIAAGAQPVPGLDPQRFSTCLAMAAQKLGKWEEARAAWDEALRAAPADPKAKAGLKEATKRALAAKKAADAAAEKAKRAAEAEAAKAKKAAEKAAKKAAAEKK